ncbi:MAG: rhomboid family intramembrane serine protease [Desulfobulbus sp.]|nr:rhomboid family intramembrane serine protease [Desulfobulbus sp.]
MTEQSDLYEKGIAVITAEPDEHLETLSLVLSAVGIDHGLDPSGEHLFVPIDLEQAARFELEQYRLENRDWPLSTPASHSLTKGQTFPTLLAMTMLVFWYGHTGPWSSAHLWYARGMIDSVAILERDEWWRLFTALTLHADLAHLLGNSFLGGVIICLLSRTIGYGLAWMLLILSGGAGNFCNIVLRQSMHLSVGFSTAVFGAIGLLIGLTVSRGLSPRPHRAVLLPLGAGGALLAVLGAGGEQTDLGAHFFGCMIGTVLGLLTGVVRIFRKLQSYRWQPYLFLMALLMLFFSWFAALR